MNVQKGREGLRAWQDSKPTNFFAADSNIQSVLRFYLGEERYAAARESLEVLGGHAATTINEGAILEDRMGNHPVLDRFTDIGERTEDIRFHPNHDRIGRLVFESGIMALQAEPGNTVQQMSLYYQLCQNGEAGHMCSIACTSGLIRALQQYGSPELQKKYLTPLLNPNYDEKHHGAQFLTEVQGGSDVGTNSLTATPVDDGTWRLNGEKWFCSNISADQFLLTARPEGATDGTRGLGLFLVPRLLDDGTINGFHLRRVKEKLGTRTLPTAEVDFIDAVAYPVGPLDRGFKIVVELVLNVSRMSNAVGATGAMRRALVEASCFACEREAFGETIINYPLVQEALALIKSETVAAVSSTFALADLLDRVETGQASEAEQGFYRLLVNVNKYWTSIRASEVIHKGIEVLGGNGAIEEFSVLPRLYRDAIVYESWEGSHNVLCLQVMRDCAKYGVHHQSLEVMNERLGSVTDGQLDGLRDEVRGRLEGLTEQLDMLVKGDPAYAQAHIRRLLDRLAVAMQAGLLLTEVQWEANAGVPSDKAEVIDFLLNYHLREGYDPLDDAGYVGRLARLTANL
jgi:alkylation response protein AidB-like acyl-CoA dehydrogenase